MKKIITICFLLIATGINVNAQTIESIVTDHTQPNPKFNSGASAGDAVDIIMHFLNSYASLHCSNTLGASLKPQIDSIKNKYRGVIPPGVSADFLVITNKFTCTVVEIVQKTQEVHIVNNACSIGDIQLQAPDTLVNSDTAGYFTITVTF